MKKVSLLLIIIIMLIPGIVKAEETTNNKSSEIKEENSSDSKETNTDNDNSSSNNSSTSLISNAKAGVLMDATTGEIIFEKNKDEKLAVASMTKMVAQIIILEQIEEGKIKWTDKVTASANASGMGGSQIYLTTGEVMSVEDMMKGISMASANDVVVTKKQLQVIREEITI